MKKLSVEQKVKAYDEALERAKGVIEQNPLMEYLKKGIEYIFPELKESEDERIKKGLLYVIEHHPTLPTEEAEEYIAWLEKQGTPAKLSEEEQNRFSKGVLKSCALSFIDYLDAHKYEGKMCVSNGECEDIENAFHNAMWDRLHRYYCKYIEKQGEQPADKIEPKFHEGEWITNGDYTWKIVEVKPLDYILQSQNGNIVDDTISHVDKQFHSFTIEDAKDGDILNSARVKATIIFKGFNSDGKHINAYCALQQGILIKQEMLWDRDFEPATKKQYDTLMKTMADAGYIFDFDKKELKKIIEEVDGEDYGIDGLWHAQTILEKTLGKVEGYQSDDGILEHKAAITAVKKLKEYENLVNYINNERNKINFYYDGKEVPWNEIPLDIRKHDYPYYFKDDLDCYPF